MQIEMHLDFDGFKWNPLDLRGNRIMKPLISLWLESIGKHM